MEKTIKIKITILVFWQNFIFFYVQFYLAECSGSLPPFAIPFFCIIFECKFLFTQISSELNTKMSWLFDNKQQHTTHRKFRTITDGQKSAFTPLGKFKKKKFFFQPQPIERYAWLYCGNRFNEIILIFTSYNVPNTLY